MTSYVPPLKNSAAGYVGYVTLKPQTATGAFVTNPTLASGDVKISIDGGAFNNLGTLPDVEPNGGAQVRFILSQAETNGDSLGILFHDAAGAEWCDVYVLLQTVSQQFDSLAAQATLVTVGGVVTDIFDIVNVLTFTVPGYLDVNIQYVNNIEVTGTGTPGDTWGPV